VDFSPESAVSRMVKDVPLLLLQEHILKHSTLEKRTFQVA
jgi:hypothetical protein